MYRQPCLVKAQSKMARGIVSPDKQIKQGLLDACGDTRTLILYGHPQLATFILGHNADLAAASVGKGVGDDFPHCDF